MKTKEEQKQAAHEIFNLVLREWMEVNRLSVNDAQEAIGVSRGVFHSWTMRPSDPKFPTFVGFLELVEKIGLSDTLERKVISKDEKGNPYPETLEIQNKQTGRHGRKLNYVKILTGKDFTDYEKILEEQLQKLQQIVEEQKGAIKYLESKLA